MPALPSDLRKQLENVCVAARGLAETGARSALQKRAVDAAKPHRHFEKADKDLRNRLRARGRQIGDELGKDDTQSIDQLTQELAYEYWHRMLFARFLAENGLLIDPDLDTSVDLDYCEEVAAKKGAANGYALAARFASKMLPEIFRTDDVLLEIEFATEHRTALEKELKKLPKQTFLADDSLGWVYQFWQSKKKDEVNASGDKIGAKTVSAVTQLFTEHYMVQFLLHNTIGAWWCAKHGIKGQGAGVSQDQCPVEMEYLRWRGDGTPAAGTFDGWPKTLKEFKLIDPCCGSGHFLVSAFNLLVLLRMHDSKVPAQEACNAVLRDNLYGLELDPRCTQIAAFALALAAWKYPGADGRPLGHWTLPPLHIACSGIGPQATKEEWLELAKQSGRPMNAASRQPILDGLENLHTLFSDAPTLGSLIDPNQLPADLITADYQTLKPYLDAALKVERTDDDAHERAVAAAGMVKAAELLAGEYTLVVTNVPYLGRGKQDDKLKEHLEKHYPEGKADIATAFVLRCLDLCAKSGTAGLVTPQTWLFLGSYRELRKKLLMETEWDALARLGAGAFETITGEVVTVGLFILSTTSPVESRRIFCLDASEESSTAEKRTFLLTHDGLCINQISQMQNPDSRVILGNVVQTKLLSEYAHSYAGINCGDSPRFLRCFWELPFLLKGWVYQQSAGSGNGDFDGFHSIFLWEDGTGRFADFVNDLGGRLGGSWKRGEEAWGKFGVAIGRMRSLHASIYTGNLFDQDTAVLLPNDPSCLLAIWSFCKSNDFQASVRQIDQKANITNATLAKVPFDVAYWQTVAEKEFASGLPSACSDDPTQWLFKGDIATSSDPLQVAVARLLGYSWPEQAPVADASGSDDPVDALIDADGIVCLSGVRGEAPAAERLLEVLHAAYGKKWSDAILHQLLTNASCAAGTKLDDWLRNQFFEQHCKRFHHRPFIWHIWDGRKDGFSALVNYHKLNHKALENLTYSYLGDWITAQKRSDSTGADLRLAAAEALQEKLKLILAGEKPYDIFVRWKPLREQSIGWHPDLNDGVRMNIRPFVEADILRKKPNIKWSKDRGKEPKRDKKDYPWFWDGDEPSGERVNDVHLTIAEKQAALKK